MDAFHQFFLLYEYGRVEAALNVIRPSPDASYDTLHSDEPAFPNLANFVYAATSGTYDDACLAISCLIGLIETNEAFTELYPRSLQRLRDEKETLLRECQSKKIERHTSLTLGWERLLASKHELSLDLSFDVSIDLPWYSLTYDKDFTLPIFSPGKTPLLFLEPLKGDFPALFHSLQGKPVLFVFETLSSLQQMLQFPGFVESLEDPLHDTYRFDAYPSKSFRDKDFEPHFLMPRPSIEAYLPVFQEALRADHRDWLYAIGKRLLYSIQSARLGVDRAPALHYYWGQRDWLDPHKGLTYQGKDLGPEPLDLFKNKLEELAHKGGVKIQPKKKNKKTLVHVVSNLVDGGHAPSRILEGLVVNHNPKAFDIALISTEKYQILPFEYPYSWFMSTPSEIRAKERIKLFKDCGARLYILPPFTTYEGRAWEVADLLQSLEADVVVFHGGDELHYLAAQLTRAPLRLFFEHGTPPSYPGFDLALVSTQSALETYRTLFDTLHVKPYLLEFAIDKIHPSSLPPPKPKEAFGLPAHALVMTTISNHLDHRLSDEMCQAIAEILQRVPRAYYVPMGKVENPQKFRDFFEKSHVYERVKFLGLIDDPGSTARSFDLYLNEFPFGSCYGLLDAMGAGCPVVTMFDKKGPQQARYGGDFIGLDKAITSLSVQDYVQLACQLLTSPQMHAEWSAHSKKMYAARPDFLTYTQKFEKIIHQELSI